MSMNEPRRTPRPPGAGGPRSPRSASPALAVVFAIVAALLGFVILHAIDDKDSGVSTGGNGGGKSTTTSSSLPTETTPPPTTVPPVDKSAFTIVVANASGVKGSAKGLSDQLNTAGYQTLTPTNAVDSTPRATTVVYYYQGADVQGKDVSSWLGLGGLAQELPTDPSQLPVKAESLTGSPRNASVLILLGTDLSGKTIPTTTVAAATAPAASVGASPNASTPASGG